MHGTNMPQRTPSRPKIASLDHPVPLASCTCGVFEVGISKERNSKWNIQTVTERILKWLRDIPVGSSAIGMAGLTYRGISGGGCGHLIRN